MTENNNFIIDDEVAARRFVLSLGNRIFNQRFNDYKSWKPSHTIIALAHGKPVALADAVVAVPGEAAEFSLIARPNFGGHAIKAMLRLKKHVPTRYWSTSLNKPSAATVAISRRFADVTFDRFSLQLAEEISKIYGERPEFEPIVLFPSVNNLLARQIPPMRLWNTASKSQILLAAQNPHKLSIEDPSGGLLGKDLLGFASDILNIPISARQTFSRILMFGTAAMMGFPINPKKFGPLIPERNMSLVLEPLMNASPGATSGGIFKIYPNDAKIPNYLQQEIRKLT